MINFFVLMFVLDRVLYRPIIKVLDERDDRIIGGQEKTKELVEKCDVILTSYNEQLHEAKVNALGVKNSARKEASVQANGIIADARKQSEQIIAETREQMVKEIARTKQELEPELTGMAAGIARQILGRKVA